MPTPRQSSKETSMTERWRIRVFLVAGPIFLGLYCYAAMNLPAWGSYRGPYGDAISRLVVYQRHATDAVNAINYDYRALDTLGEEFILFTAVLGVMRTVQRSRLRPRGRRFLSSPAIGGSSLAPCLVLC